MHTRTLGPFQKRVPHVGTEKLANFFEPNKSLKIWPLMVIPLTTARSLLLNCDWLRETEKERRKYPRPPVEYCTSCVVVVFSVGASTVASRENPSAAGHLPKMRWLPFLLATVASAADFEHPETLERFAFGSCNKHDYPQVWSADGSE